MEKSDKRTRLFILAGLMVLVVLVYSGSFSHGFMWGWDDGEYLEDRHIAELSWNNLVNYFSQYYLGMYQPLSVLTIALNISLSGINPAPFHATNIFLHMINAALVFSIFRRLFSRDIIAFTAALIFAIHPMNVEGVAWIAARSTTLFAAFYLAAIVFYMKYQDSGKIVHYFLAMALFIGALFSKSMAISFPLLIIILDYLKYQRISRKAWIEKIPFLFLSLVFGMVTLDAARSFGHLEGMEYSYSLINRIFILSYAIVLYLVKFIIPLRLSVIYGFPEEAGGTLPLQYYLSLLAIAIIIAGLWMIRKRKKELAAGFLFFLVTIAPVLPIFWSRMFLAGERYVYVPYLGLMLILCTGMEAIIKAPGIKFDKYRTALAGMLILYMIYLGISSFQRIKVWENPDRLLSAVIDQNPSKNTLAAAYFFRGNVRDRYQDYPAALRDFNQSLQRNPDNVLALNNRGIVKGILNDFEGAIKDFDRSIQIDPGYVDAYYNRGIAYFQLEQQDLACRDWEQASSMGSTRARAVLQKYCRTGKTH